jgi:uncharacterized membrane protein
MNEIALGVKVECTDGHAGTSTHIIMDPTTRAITHLVVSDNEPVVDHRYLVPTEYVTESRHDVIRLKCTQEELSQLDQFIDVHFIENPQPESGYPADSVYLAPYVSPLDLEYIPVEVERIPLGELAVRRGAVVEATDGYVGRFGEFMVDPQSGAATHLVLQEGHLWGKREIVLPFSAVDQMLESTITLKLDKASVEKLPSIPVLRDYGEGDEAHKLELLAKLYENTTEASEGLKKIKELQRAKKDIFKIRNAAILIKDQDGNTSIKETADVDTKHGRVFGAAVGGLIGLVGGPVGVILGALTGAGVGAFAAKHIDMGFSDDFLKGFDERLQPGSSALLILVDHHGADELFESLVDRKNIVLRHTLSDNIVDQLLEDESTNNQDQTQEGDSVS